MGNPPTFTTLNAIRACNPCKSGWERLLKSLGKTEADDEPLLFSTIIASNGLSDACWCLQALPKDAMPLLPLIAADFAESVLHIYEAYAPDDNRPRKAIEAARNKRDSPVVSAAAVDAAAVDAAARAAAAAIGAAARAAEAAVLDARAAERKKQAEILIK